MRNVITIFRREVLSFFVSPVAYFVITGFVLLGGYFFFNLLAIFNLMVERYSQMPYRMGNDGPNLNQWVVEPYYHTLIVILVFLIPVLTMRSLAEERRRGTFELLITSPLNIWEIIMGKFLGVGFVIFVMLLLSFVFPFLLVQFGKPGPEIAPIMSGFLAVLLCGLGFASLAIAASAFTENQIVAAISGMVALLLLYVIHSPSESLGGTPGQVLEYLSPVIQSREMIQGVLSLQSCTYFFSLIIFGLFLSERGLEAFRWR